MNAAQHKSTIANINNALAEIEGWNSADAHRLNNGTVDFDGSFVFLARQRKITQLKKLVAELKPEIKP